MNSSDYAALTFLVGAADTVTSAQGSIFFVWHCKPDAQVSMRKYSGQVIDINATASKLGSKCHDLLTINALSGCDTTSYPFGKGKVSAVNLLPKLYLNLQVFADLEAQEGDKYTTARNSSDHAALTFLEFSFINIIYT